MNLEKLSKEISYALRHAPWEYELELDEEGFVPIEQRIHALNEGGNYVDDRRSPRKTWKKSSALPTRSATKS